MSVLIIGGKGNMGRRYQAVLTYLEKDFEVYDLDTKTPLSTMLKRANGVIIASPTDNHVDHIIEAAPHRIPILCEKPISKKIGQTGHALSVVRASDSPFSMVFNYKVMMDRYSLNAKLPTQFNYFKHGSDGLAWDCIQIIGLSKSRITLQETSPVWKCSINGKKLHFSHIDRSYIKMIEAWFKKPKQDLIEILEVHQKTSELEKVYG